MNKCYCLLNHCLLDKQRKELKEKYGVMEVVIAPENIEKLWENVPAEEKIPQTFFDTVEAWLDSADEGDVFIVQGEPTAAFTIILHLLKKGLTVLAGVTERRTTYKEQNGMVIKTSVYEHVCFRKYSE